MAKIILIIQTLFISSFVCGCIEPDKKATISSKYISSEINSNISQNDTISIDECIGVLVYKGSDSTEISVLNEHGSYEKFCLNKMPKKIKPYAYHPDYYLLMFKCIKDSSDKYKIILNDENSTFSYIEKKDTLFEYQTWGKHILNLFSISSDFSKNPIRNKPNQNAKTIQDIDFKNEFFHPVSIEKEWLQVKWGTEGDWQYGWLKWYENNKLLIELFYF